MALTKQPVSINFSAGLDQKTDPYQLAVGKFIALDNVVQTKQGLLNKRNGNLELATLPTLDYSYLTTFNGNLTAISNNLAALIAGQNEWVTKGSIQPVEMNVLPLIRSNLTQTQADANISDNGLVCTAYTDGGIFKAAVFDSTTGQNVVDPSTFQTLTGVTATGAPKVFWLKPFFIVIFTAHQGGVDDLVYWAYNAYSGNTAAAFISTGGYLSTTQGSFDAIVANNSLYIAWNDTSSTSIHMKKLSNSLILGALFTYSGHGAEIMSLCADATGNLPVIYANYYESSSGQDILLVVDNNLATITGPEVVSPLSNPVTANITASAQNGQVTVFYEKVNAYAYDSSIPTNYIELAVYAQDGTIITHEVQLIRSVGLASKSIILNGNIYLLTAYESPYQSSYFLIDSSANIIAKLAYSNGGGYLPNGLPNLCLNALGGLQCAYLFKDAIQAVNKNTNVPAGSQTAGVYSQLGVNLATFTLTTQGLLSAEIGQNLNITGGFLWGYDGIQPVEQNFFVWPDSIEVTGSTTGGSLSAQQYYYQVTYEWTDNMGNAFRSAPSIPVSVTTTGTTSSVTVNIPRLRLTYKISSPVKLVVYRWSTGQQSYYQTTSITSPLLNNSSGTPDSVTFTDTNSDATILGNNLIYTTGGVVENINGPAATAVTLFDTRLWLIDAEDQNLLWFSKQVIEATPVEMSDLFTIYVPPSSGTSGSTGVILFLAPMDDKLIIFKENAIYYINGSGPDNTGANNQYSQAIFVTSTIGCSNGRSIALTPQGLMFQSNNGIWLLGRDLSTTFIGAPVNNYNNNRVLSALNIPQTNLVKFNLDNGITLVYNYFFEQWGTQSGIQPISSTSYQSLTTFIDKYGRTFQENPDSYLDGSNPVLISFTTGWFNLTGLQGFQRFYYMQLLGTYFAPHTLTVSIAYDYADNPSQQILIQPDNYSPAWGSDISWGSGQQWGGALPLEQWQIFPEIQKCQSFQISMQEQYDASIPSNSAAGLSLSGLNMVIGTKKGYAKLPSSRQAG